MQMHNPPHPGESLREDVIPAIGLTVSALAEHLGYSRSHLSSVAKGNAAITAKLVYRLELSGLGAAHVWLAQQAAYDLWQAQQSTHPAICRLHWIEPR